MKNTIIRYDIAISFAGEDRNYVSPLAHKLRENGISIFYDEYEQANLWGKDLYVHLNDVYKDQSKYCLMIVSNSYSKKQWTNHERRAAQARAFQENREYILPLRLDDANVDGILPTTGFIDARNKTHEEIVSLIKEKVKKFNAESGIEVEVTKAERVFQLANITDNDGSQIMDVSLETGCPTCGTTQTLSEAEISLVGNETVYQCKNGCQPILVVGKPGIKPINGRGYRLRAFVIRNTKDLYIILKNGSKVLLPSSPASLRKVD